MNRKIDIFELLIKIKSILLKNNVKAYIVGGFLRNYLLKRKSLDIDLVLIKDCKKIVSLIADLLKAPYFPLKEKLHLYRINYKNFTIDFSELNSKTIYDNLSFRDFTINSIAYPLDKFSKQIDKNYLVDPLKGLEDLRNKVIKHNSSSIFMEDPIRMLRAFRLKAQFNFSIHPSTLQLISQQSALINQAAPERISNELTKIFSHPCSSEIIKEMDNCNLLNEIFPEINQAKGCLQLGYHELDVWQHSLNSLFQLEKIFNNLKSIFPINYKSLQKMIASPLSNSLNIKIALKITALFHDLGKPSTKELHKNADRYSFINHEKEGASLTKTILKRLKFDNASISFIYFLIANHLALSNYYENNLSSEKYLNRFFIKYSDFALPLILIFLADKLSQKPSLQDSAPINFAQLYINYYFKDFRKLKKQKPLINGKDLIKKYNLTPGPLIGNLLALIKEAQINKEVKTKRDCYNLIESKHPEIIKSHRKLK